MGSVKSIILYLVGFILAAMLFGFVKAAILQWHSNKKAAAKAAVKEADAPDFAQKQEEPAKKQAGEKAPEKKDAGKKPAPDKPMVRRLKSADEKDPGKPEDKFH